MKKFRFALLLGVLCSTLVGCGGNNNPDTNQHTITFNGTNCYMKNIGEDKPITEPIKVNDGATVSYTIYTKAIEKYIVPTELDISGDVKYTYKVESLDLPRNATLNLENIKSDIKITASARSDEICSITYYSDESCQWAERPSMVSKNEDIVAHIRVNEGFVFTKDNFVVFVEGMQDILDSSKYDYKNGVFTVYGESVINNVFIYAHKEGPTPPTPGEYEVSFTMENAEEYFPESQTQGIPLEGYFIANEGYRVPTKEELAPTGRQIDGTILKIKEGVTHHLTQDQFYYETYTDETTGRSAAYLYIFDYQELLDAEKIEIGGTPVKQFTVTFDAGEGHWSDGTVGQKSAIVDRGKVVEDAMTLSKAYAESDDPAKHFDVWKDNKGSEVTSQTQVFDDMELTAAYDAITFNIYTLYTVIGATFTDLPESVKYHQAVTDVTVTANETTAKLPEKKDVEIIMGAGDKSRRLTSGEFTYEFTDGTHHSANFGIAADVIEDNITIHLKATEMIEVTFDPDGGTWPNTQIIGAQSYECEPGTLTYNQIFSKLGTGGNPTKGGKNLEGWYYINGETKTPIPMDNLATMTLTITAVYVETANFSNDTWANVIINANNGTLDTAYGSSIYIGATRQVSYTDPTTQETYIYDVRLIGRNHDDLANANGKAPLTFEFVNLIGQGLYGHDETTWGTTPNNNWEHSDYRAHMEWAYDALIENNPDLAVNNGIKEVTKKTMQGKVEGESPSVVMPFNEKLFPLSGSEMMIPKQNKEINVVHYNYDSDWEGAPYEYYYLGGYYVKTYLGEQNYSSYWLRSPFTQSETGEAVESQAYVLKGSDISGELGDYTRRMTDIIDAGYAAAFCI